VGRQAERATLDRLLADVRGGESRSLMVRGEAGVGKSALLAHLLDQASGCQVVSAIAARAETGLTFAALHQLCAPMLGLLDSLPAPQRDALGTAFGVHTGPAPDRLLVGIAVLGLVAAAAKDRPVVYVIDDAQWLDHASAQVLAFVTRRPSVTAAAFVFAVRDAGEEHELSGLPVMDVAGLAEPDARALLLSVLPGRLDDQVRDRIIAESRGNPLALLTMLRERGHAELAGGFGLPAERTRPSAGVEDAVARRLARMSRSARQLLLLAAAEPRGDPVLLWRAAKRLGLAASDAVDDMIDLDTQVRFRAPTLRAAVYRAACPAERRTAHRALADVETDPVLAAWHRGLGTAEPDEAVAAALERSAEPAQTRGGLAAAAAFLARAAALTPDSRRRAERALAAAQAGHLAGAPAAALTLLTAARGGSPDEPRCARVDRLRAEIVFTTERGDRAPAMLLDAARQLEPLDPAAARETYLQALCASMFAGRLAGTAGPAEIAANVGADPSPPVRARATDLLLDGLALHLTKDADTATPVMSQALHACLDDETSASVEDQLRRLWPAYLTATALWDDASCRALAERHVRLARHTAALSVLPLALSARITVHLFEGELAEAASLTEEARTVIAATGCRITNHGAVLLTAWQGRQSFVRAAAGEATARGDGLGLSICDWASAVLHNGLGHYEEALVAARRAAADPPTPGAAAHWAPVELIEAATRGGGDALAADAFARLVQTTQAAPTDWALGIEARSRALLDQGHTAERHYREAIERLGRTRLRPDLARAHLLYGEWLRREKRRLAAREQLRTAHELFTVMGLEAFADRAARELLATGEITRRGAAFDQLTPQEAQVATLARTGLTNREIAGRLHVSPRTVEWHLRKVFAKQGITSRRQLDRAP
jgi:DNA-binding CsgD family transcriptional regulator/tetratricopeptide (TPR) repeat protein